MSGPALASPPLPEPVRAAAAAEIAVELGRPWLARALAARALSADPACHRALVVHERLHGVGFAPRRHLTSDIGAALVAGVLPDVSRAEAAAIVVAILEHGHSRARPSHRHRGEPLRAGSRLVVHHALPDVAIVVRARRAIGVRLRGQTIGRAGPR